MAAGPTNDVHAALIWDAQRDLLVSCKMMGIFKAEVPQLRKYAYLPPGRELDEKINTDLISVGLQPAAG